MFFLEIRQEERKWLSKLAFYDSTTISLTPTVSIVATIVTILAYLSTGDNLTVAQVSKLNFFKSSKN